MTGSEKQQRELKKKLLTQKQQRQHKFSFGSAAERQAAQFLKTNNFKILDTNVQYRLWEVDIIAFDTKLSELVFVEVKARTSQQTHPVLAVTNKKINNMQAVAAAYLRKIPQKLNYRFDIITITHGEIEHFRNITWI